MCASCCWFGWPIVLSSWGVLAPEFCQFNHRMDWTGTLYGRCCHGNPPGTLTSKARESLVHWLLGQLALSLWWLGLLNLPSAMPCHTMGPPLTKVHGPLLGIALSLHAALGVCCVSWWSDPCLLLHGGWYCIVKTSHLMNTSRSHTYTPQAHTIR